MNMKNHEMAILLRDDQRLAELEKTIARGKKTFVEVGLALAEIRDVRLYRRDYGSFSEYCREKWGWSKSYAYDIIQSAEVVKTLPEKVSAIADTENKVRELRKAPAEQRAAILEAVAAEGKPVTAAAIKRHLPPVPVCPSSPPTAMVDGTGWPIPTHLIPLWQRMDEVQEMLTTLSRVKGALRAAQENKDKLFTEVNFSSALSHLDQVWSDVKTAKPFAVCPACQGQLPDQCTLCRGRGLLSEHRWNACVTREDKEFRTKVRAKGKAN